MFPGLARGVGRSAGCFQGKETTACVYLGRESTLITLYVCINKKMNTQGKEATTCVYRELPVISAFTCLKCTRQSQYQTPLKRSNKHSPGHPSQMTARSRLTHICQYFFEILEIYYFRDFQSHRSAHSAMVWSGYQLKRAYSVHAPAQRATG